MEKALIAGPCIGEFYWEFGRFASHVLWKKKKLQKKYKDLKLVILTRPDRFDIYGSNADILVNLKLDPEVKQNCFGMMPYKRDFYLKYVNAFKRQYQKRFDIVEHIYPILEKRGTCNRNMYRYSEMSYSYKPRIENKIIVDEYLKDVDKKIVVLGPRYRKDFPRNWPYWQDLYDLIYKDKKLMDKYQFIICGKSPDYVPDKKKRFIDINNFKLDEKSSMVGLLIEVMRRSSFTIGSQSAIPNISLLFGVKALEWGDQKTLHTKTYNVRNTPVVFLDDVKFKLEVNVVFNELRKQLL